MICSRVIKTVAIYAALTAITILVMPRVAEFVTNALLDKQEAEEAGAE